MLFACTCQAVMFSLLNSLSPPLITLVTHRLGGNEEKKNDDSGIGFILDCSF